MYSVVLLLAATTSAETTSCHRLFRGRDCCPTVCCGAPVAPPSCSGTTPVVPPPVKETIKPPVKMPEVKPPVDMKPDMKVPDTKVDPKVDPKMVPPDGKLPVVPPAPPKASHLDAPARILVHLPADAQLTIDGKATSSISETRIFQSPTLTAQGQHFYELQAIVERSGRQIRITRLIRVQAGMTTEVNMEVPANQSLVTSQQ